MTTKYQISDIREQILVDIQEAYPKTFKVYEDSTILGENVFGEPKQHPNAVLSLFKQCGVTFPLPYAFYTACRGGLSSLTDNTIGISLPGPTLAVAVRGLGKLKAAELKAAKNILFQPKLHRCDRFSCYSGSSVNHDKDGKPVFQSVFDSIVDSSGNMATHALETPIFDAVSETLFCKTCLDTWLKGHREDRAEMWYALPEYFELGPNTNSA